MRMSILVVCMNLRHGKDTRSQSVDCWKATASRLEVIAIRLEAITSRLEERMLEAIASSLWAAGCQFLLCPPSEHLQCKQFSNLYTPLNGYNQRDQHLNLKATTMHHYLYYLQLTSC